MTPEEKIKKDQAKAAKKKAKVEARVKKLVKVLGAATLSRQGLMAELDLKREGIRNFRFNYMYPARDLGYVVMVFAGAPTCPVQSYRLTQKGLEYLAYIEEQEKKDQAESEKKDQAEA